MTFEQEAEAIAERLDAWLREMRTDVVLGPEIQNLDSFSPVALRRVMLVALMSWRNFVEIRNAVTRERKNKRVPLAEVAVRGSSREWSVFESSIFNSVTSEVVRMAHDREIKTIPMFSKRLALAQLMLDAFDDYLEGPRQ